MSIYMQIPGVQGNVQAEGYQGWIELNDVDFSGVSNPIRMDVGKAVDRNAGRPSFGQVSLLKTQDGSSIKLYEAAHSNKVFPQAEIHYVTTGSQLFAFAKMKLSNVAVSHYSEKFDSDKSRPDEVVRLTYTQMERTTIPRDSQNQAGSPMISGFDLEQAKQL